MRRREREKERKRGRDSPHGTVLLDMVGMDHMAVGTDVDVAAGVESRKYAPMSSGSARSAALELVESYRLQKLCECRERRRGYPAVVHSGKIAVLEKTLAGMGDDEPILAGKRVLEKELEKLQKKLNGPKKTRPNRIGSTENPNVSRPKLQG